MIAIDFMEELAKLNDGWPDYGVVVFKRGEQLYLSLHGATEMRRCHVPILMGAHALSSPAALWGLLSVAKERLDAELAK